MWRILFLTLILIGPAAHARAQDTSWQACQGVSGPAGQFSAANSRTGQMP